MATKNTENGKAPDLTQAPALDATFIGLLDSYIEQANNALQRQHGYLKALMDLRMAHAPKSDEVKEDDT